MTMINPILLLFAATLTHASIAFHLPSRPSPIHHLTHRSSLPSTRQRQQTRQQRHHSPSSTATSLRGLFDDDAEENEIIIPPELRDEIYAAESNTPAAQGRQTRIIVYAILTFAGVTTAFFNAFLSDLRFGEGSPSTDLAYYGFGWVMDNWVTSFAFTNKIGGGIGLLGAGLSGTLAEVEIRSKKENAEKIWTEMQRRKSLKDKPTSRSNRKKNKKKSSSLSQSSNKKNMTGKQKKRLSALEELMDDDVEEAVMPTVEVEEPKETTNDESKDAIDNNDKDDDGIFGSIKGFYKKADSMAASQALLLNKELEDRGIVEKITDETGLKVVGKEAAEKAKQQKENEE